MGPGANALFFASPTCLSLEGPSRNVLATLAKTPNLIGRYSDLRASLAPGRFPKSPRPDQTLAGGHLPDPVSYSPRLPSWGSDSNQCHQCGFRSRLPLLGSPGFAPGSLFRHHNILWCTDRSALYHRFKASVNANLCVTYTKLSHSSNGLKIWR